MYTCNKSTLLAIGRTGDLKKLYQMGKYYIRGTLDMDACVCPTVEAQLKRHRWCKFWPFLHLRGRS